MNFISKKALISLQIIEVAALFALFSLFVHLVTTSSGTGWDMTAALVIVIIAAACSLRPLNDRATSRRLWASLSAMAGGFWVFSLFRYTGFVAWPMGRPSNVTDYTHLLYFHFILTITILTPILIVSRTTRPAGAIAWGNWKHVGFWPYGTLFLVFSCVGIWALALYKIAFAGISSVGPPAAFVLISILKALLTGVTEEISYRGVIQSYATEHLNVPSGIIFQSCLFMVFHLNLVPAFFSKIIFLAGILVLGFMFGIVTRLTSGIGWACVIHVAINTIIEWQNIS